VFVRRKNMKKTLETVGVVRDNALTGEVKSGQNHSYGSATNRELNDFRVALSQSGERIEPDCNNQPNPFIP